MHLYRQHLLQLLLVRQCQTGTLKGMYMTLICWRVIHKEHFVIAALQALALLILLRRPHLQNTLRLYKFRTMRNCESQKMHADAQKILRNRVISLSRRQNTLRRLTSTPKLLVRNICFIPSLRGQYLRPISPSIRTKIRLLHFVEVNCTIAWDFISDF